MTLTPDGVGDEWKCYQSSSNDGPSSILRQSLLCDAIPDRGQVVLFAVSLSEGFKAQM